MEIAIVSYRRFTEMPRDVHNACKIMGHAGWMEGHLRGLARGETVSGEYALKYRLRSALIMYAGDTIVGWTALYYRRGDTYPSISVWIKGAHRKKGYGSQLIAAAYAKWKHHRPQVFHSVESKWKEYMRRDRLIA